MVKTLTLYACALVLCVSGMWIQPQEPEFVWVTESTIELIENFEGVRTTAYHDSQGNLTIGVGHLIRAQDRYMAHRELSRDEVRGILHNDLEKCSTALKTVLNVPITRTQSDALHSLCHNIGPDKTIASDVVKHINNNQPQKAADAFLNWSKPHVLKKRRQAERAVFLAEI